MEMVEVENGPEEFGARRAKTALKVIYEDYHFPFIRGRPKLCSGNLPVNH